MAARRRKKFDDMFSYFESTQYRPVTDGQTYGRTSCDILGGGGMAEWLASPDWDREGVGSNPGVARSDGQ